MVKHRTLLVVTSATLTLLALCCISPYLLSVMGWNVGYPVEPTGVPITRETEIQPQDEVLALWEGAWWPAEVLQVYDDGQSKIHYQGWGSEWDEVVSRARLQRPHQTADP